MEKQCKWITDHQTGDLIFKCPKKNKEFQIISEVILATSHAITGSDQHNFIVDKLKSKLTDELGCTSCNEKSSD